MANGTTITDSGTELQPARPGEERGTPTGWILDLAYTVDHKKLGMLYVGTRSLLFRAGGDHGSADSISTRFSKRSRHISAGIQRSHHRAWNGDDFLGRNAYRFRDD